MANAIGKGTNWAIAIQRISSTHTGLPPSLIPELYKAVTLPGILYWAEVFLTAMLYRSQIDYLKHPIKSGPLAKLAHAQWQAMLLATGTLRNTPNSLLSAHSNIPPFPILLHQILYRSATRLATLPSMHPLNAYVTRATTRGAKQHQSPLIQLFKINDINPKQTEKIPAIRYPPWWHPSFQTKIPDREMAIHIPEACTGELQIHTDGSVIEGKVGAAINAYWNDARWMIDRHHLGQESDFTIFEAELLAILIDVKVALRKRSIKQLTIYCDSQASILALRKTPPPQQLTF